MCAAAGRTERSPQIHASATHPPCTQPPQRVLAVDQHSAPSPGARSPVRSWRYMQTWESYSRTNWWRMSLKPLASLMMSTSRALGSAAATAYARSPSGRPAAAGRRRRAAAPAGRGARGRAQGAGRDAGGGALAARAAASWPSAACKTKSAWCPARCRACQRAAHAESVRRRAASPKRIAGVADEPSIAETRRLLVPCCASGRTASWRPLAA